VQSKLGYYAVCHPDHLSQPSVKALMKWLQGQVDVTPVD